MENTLKKSPSRSLGKGLSALMSEGYSSIANENIPEAKQPLQEHPKQTLSLTKIRSGKYQPREIFNDTALNELADSIRKNGVMQPILVRAISDDNYEIVAGERRWRAAKLAGLDEIPVMIREMADEQALEIAIIENVQREDLHPLEEAAGYQRLMDDFGYTQENLATAVHKSRSHIANLLRLLGLPDDIRNIFSENKISMGHARALIGSADAAQIAHEIIAKGLSVRQTEKMVSDSKNPGKPKAIRQPGQPKIYVTGGQDSSYPQAHKDADILSLEETLSENLGLKVSISDRGQAGEIVIAYESLEQLDEILRRLGGSI